jgi:hypothetical protein
MLLLRCERRVVAVGEINLLARLTTTGTSGAFCAASGLSCD